MGFERELNELKKAICERLESGFDELQLMFVSATVGKKVENFSFRLNSEKSILVGDFEE